MWWRNYDSMLSRFHRISERDGQTDGRTDWRTKLLYQYRYRASLCWRAIITLFYSPRCTHRVLKTTLTLAVINSVHWCVAIVLPRCDKLYHAVGPVDDTQPVVARHWLKIANLHELGTPVRMLPKRLVWKTQNGDTQRWEDFEDTFIPSDRIRERDRQTDGHHDGIGRAYA